MESVYECEWEREKKERKMKEGGIEERENKMDK